MVRMVTTLRRSVTLSKPQYEALVAEAERLGISVAELLRRIVDEWRTARPRGATS